MPLEPGTCLGPYEVISAIGAGGMGEVYRARDHRLERDVALKVLPTHFKPGTRQLQQFEHEARLLASLNHPSICGIYDVGSDRGVSFIVMEHLQGETLAARIERGAIPVHVALHYALQIAEALRAAHGAGLVHRDIKPGNIMLTTVGVKLLDFGLAKRHMAAPAAAATSAATTGPVDTAPLEGIVGTLHYMPPEQLAGGAVDARSDIWAFGCVIYEMVAGRRAFNGKTITEVIAAIVTDRPALMAVDHGVAPIALHHFVSKCLARNPIERWQSVAELMGELRSMLPHATQASAPSPAVTSSPVAPSPPRPAPAPGSSSSSPPLAQERATPRRPRRTAIVAAAALVAASALAAWFISIRLMSPQKSLVAVLPFENGGGGADLDDLAEGLPKGVVDELGRREQVRAVPSSVAFRHRSSDARRAGKALGAERVLSGRLSMRSGRIEVDTTLVDVATGSARWSHHFSGSPADVTPLQRELTAGVLEGLGVESTSKDQAPPALSAGLAGDAYRLLLRGRYAASRRDERSLRGAIGFFTNAAAKEATLAPAFAGIAASYIELAHFTVAAVRPSDAFPRVMAAASKALELDPLLADAHVALGFGKSLGDRDWAGAGAEYDRAVTLQPYDPFARQWYSEWLMNVGRAPEALTEARAASQLDPLSPAASLNLGWQLFLARQYPDAIAQLQTTVTANPNLVAAHWALGMAYIEAGKPDDGLNQLKAAAAGAPVRPVHLAGLAYGNARAHRTADATQQLARLRTMSATEYVSPFDLALIALALDDYTRAFELLQRAVDEHATAAGSLAVDPRFDLLRSDARFKDLLKRAGLSKGSP